MTEAVFGTVKDAALEHEAQYQTTSLSKPSLCYKAFVYFVDILKQQEHNEDDISGNRFSSFTPSLESRAGFECTVTVSSTASDVQLSL